MSGIAIVVRVDAPGAITNTAEVSHAAQFDPDSLFWNGDPTEDDQASVTITAG